MKFITWITAHLNLIAWPTVVVLAWKVSARMKEYQSRFEAAESTLQKLATNHLPHMQAELEKINAAITTGFSGLSRDLLIILSGKKE